MISHAHDHDAERDVSLMAKDQYMREVRWVSCLTHEEEEKLLQRVKRGNAERAQPQPNEWVLSLAKHAREGLIETFQPLVISLARRFAPLFKSMDWLDVVQEGNVGLVEALDNWGVATFVGSFTSYAAVCIRHAIFHALCGRDANVHIPSHVLASFVTSRKVKRQLRTVLGRDALPAEVAVEMGLSESELEEVDEAATCRYAKSLQGLLAEDRDEDTYGFVALYDAAAVAEDARQAELSEVFQQALERVLSPSQRQIVELRYGFGDGPGSLRTRKIVADWLGISQTAVEESEGKAKVRLGQVLEPVVLADGRLSCALDPMYGEDYCTTDEVARLLGVSTTAVSRAVLRGELACEWALRPKCGKRRCRVFARAAVMELVQARCSAVVPSSVA